MRYATYLFFVLAVCLAASAAASSGEALPNWAGRIVTPSDKADIEADEVVGTVQDGYVQLKGHVKVSYGDLTFTADEASINQSTGEFEARGEVTVAMASRDASWKAPYVRGNLMKRSIQFGPYRLTSPVWNCGGESCDGSTGNGELVVQNGWVSTCDREEPHYCLQARTVVVDTEKKWFSGRHITLRFGGVPVFYFPWLSGSTDGYSTFIFKPGYSGKKGAYLRIGRFAPVWEDGRGDVYMGSVYLDLMSRRGIGVGASLELKEKERQATAGDGPEDASSQESAPRRVLEGNAYGLHDLRPPETSDGYNRRFKSQNDRFRVNAYYHESLAERLSLRANVDFLSDIDMLEDWFKHDYRDIRQPRSYIHLAWDGGWHDAGMQFRPRINDFYSVVEKLPELYWNVARLSLAGTPLEYESRTSAGYYSMKWRNYDRRRRLVLPEELDDSQYLEPSDYESLRLHTQHFLYLPVSLDSLGVLTPRAGAALTHYSRSSRTAVTPRDISENVKEDNPDLMRSLARVRQYDADGGGLTRLAFETGIEWKASFHSDWMERTLPALGIDGIRHVAEPYMNYTYMHEPTKNRDCIYYFDDLDRLEKQHFVRFGLDQRWRTRQEEGGERTFLRLDSYFDLHFDEDEEHGRHGGQWGTSLVYSPWETLRLHGAFVYDVGEGAVHRGEVGIACGAKTDFNWRLRYMFRNDHFSRSVYSLGSSLLDLTGESGYLKREFEYSDSIRGKVEIPLDSNTWFDIEAEYDFARGRLAEHTYTIRRRLHCWTASFGIGWDYTEFEAMVMFSLTAFPKVKLDLNL